jgi:uncharacterized protein YraI
MDAQPSRHARRHIGFALAASLAMLFAALPEVVVAQIASRFVKVDNIAKGRVLWLRSGPGRGYERIGLLPYNARRIRNYGCRQRATGYWCEIRYRGQHGWASGRFLAEDRARRT